MLFKFCTRLLNLTNKCTFSFNILQNKKNQPVNISKQIEIISLNNEEINQLASISTYLSSIQYLQQNNLEKSLDYLHFSLEQAKSSFPYSINLHACLMNRISILFKLLNKNKQFLEILEEIYLIALSSKGPKSLDTLKSLNNYLTSLLINNTKKACSVTDYLRSSQKGKKNIIFFDGVLDIINRGKYKEGLEKLYQLPEKQNYEKYFKFNNIGWMKTISICKQHLGAKQRQDSLKKQQQTILSYYLKALLVAENSPVQGVNYAKENMGNQDYQKFIQGINSYINKQTQVLRRFLPTNLLKNSQSHIISMNIASILFQVQRFEECYFYIQLTFEKAVSLNQLQRIGLALILMAKHHHLHKIHLWDKIFLQILENVQKYSKSIIKQTLCEYSKILFQEGRLVEAQSYYFQSQRLVSDSDLEGLILPAYDFSY